VSRHVLRDHVWNVKPGTVLRGRKFATLLLIFGVVTLILGNRRSTVWPYAERFEEGAGQAEGERP
jgi:hypothetical protein